MLICSLPPLRRNGFVNLFVFGGTRRNLQLGKEPPRARGGSRDYIGGALPPPNPPVLFFEDFGRARFGSIWGAPMYRIQQLLDDYVNRFGGLPSGEAVLRSFAQGRPATGEFL